MMKKNILVFFSLLVPLGLSSCVTMSSLPSTEGLERLNGVISFDYGTIEPNKATLVFVGEGGSSMQGVSLNSIDLGDNVYDKENASRVTSFLSGDKIEIFSEGGNSKFSLVDKGSVAQVVQMRASGSPEGAFDFYSEIDDRILINTVRYSIQFAVNQDGSYIPCRDLTDPNDAWVVFDEDENVADSSLGTSLVFARAVYTFDPR
jgi:hypothetical protein